MDLGIVAIVVIIVFAVIVLVALFRPRNFRGKAQGPLGTGVEFESSKPQQPTTPGVLMEDVTARQGSITGRNEAGSGAVIKRADAGEDVSLINTPPGNSTDPKA